MKVRCAWAGTDPLYVAYHDKEWGRPVRDDRVLFEFLTLEGAQAGLSWITILRKREAYRRAFAGFDPRKVARFGVKDRGYVREGAYADLVLVDPKTPTMVTKESLLYRCGWSPFEGSEFSHSIASTWVNGELAWDGAKLAAKPHGKRLEFA